jgi:ribonuclease HII
MLTVPDFRFEAQALARGALRVAGLDEVGRGPLAGPVMAAAVRLAPGRIPPGLRDSKTLTARARQRLALELHEVAEVAVAEASVEEIDALNILRASQLAMERAVALLPLGADFLLIDGNQIPRGLTGRSQAIVRGDAHCLSIAAASIVAKVARDAVMVDLAQQFPGYGWERNAGYPTAEHRAALKILGVTPVHRRSFAPVHNILYQDISLTP